MEIFEINKNILFENYNYLSNKINCDKLFYAMKANGNDLVIKSLSDFGAGFEISSEGELQKVINCNVSPDNIISSIPVKTVNFIKNAYNYGVRYFVFDCLEELQRLITYAPDAKKIMRVYIQDVDSESYVWGIKYDEFLKIKENNSALFNMIDGISIHISRNYQIRLLDKIFDRLECFVKEFNQNKKIIVNIGGGYFCKLPPYLEYKYNLDNYYIELNKKLDLLRDKFSLEIYCEPGRGIVDSACNLILPIQLLNVRNGKNIVFVNLNAYQIGTLPIKIERIRNGETKLIFDADWVLDRKVKREKIVYSLVDTLCEWNELMKITSCEELQSMDVLKLYGVGAYSVTLSSDFHSRGRIKSVVI
ncbi:MAG: hypothetical protein UIM53_03525 [Acutalibacteraceae bacterium]|nr:hypothetical protein [Acutalibacteraceae bacterium]